jgi:Uma2 family endonuclease
MLDILKQPEVLRHALPISVACYEKMAELGLVEERTELIRGVIFEKMSKSPLHCFLLDLLSERLRAVLPPSLIARVEAPLTLAQSSPEPDLCVVPGPRERYISKHPESARLVIEISLSSEAIYREKTAIYAEAGVEEYWIVLPERRAIERFSLPSSHGFLRIENFRAEETVDSLTVAGFTVVLNELPGGKTATRL